VLIGEAFTESLSGIPVLKTETQLRDAVKEGLERLQQKGIYDEIVKKYGLQANKLTPIAINQGKD
jgi:polar amino acid transport system substrate-binding protein